MRGKLLFILLFCLFSIIGGQLVSAQSLGDVNGSGTIDILDALMVAQYYVGLVPGFC